MKELSVAGSNVDLRALCTHCFGSDVGHFVFAVRVQTKELSVAGSNVDLRVLCTIDSAAMSSISFLICCEVT